MRSLRLTGFSRPFLSMILLALVVAAGVLAGAVRADQETQGPGTNRGAFVVEDAVDQFVSLKHHGEALAWRKSEAAGATDPHNCDHYQGITRYPGQGRPIFYVSQSDVAEVPEALCKGGLGSTGGGYLHVVQFGTRDTAGERLRSNIQLSGADTEDVVPSSGDTWVSSLRFDGTMNVDGTLIPAYKHPGGMTVIDDVLFVPMDQPISGGAVGHILLFDLAADALSPVPLQALPLLHGIDNLAVTRRANDGGYLIWTNGDGGEDINVYATTHTDLHDDDLGLRPVQAGDNRWDPSVGFIGAGWPTGTGAHQSSTFVREPDGSLFLIGMRHPGGLPSLGSDYADLYRVLEPTPDRFVLLHLRSQNLHCVYDGGGGRADMRICNFAAATGGYVSPSGELILYGLPHDDEDQFNDIVRMAEFRHRDVTRETNPIRTAQAQAGGPYVASEGSALSLFGTGSEARDRPWVELYDDVRYRDRSIVVDYDDRHLLELSNFNNLDRFSDKTSSVRWRAPAGVDIYLYDDDGFRGRYIVLRGAGRTQAISDLNTQPVVDGLVEHFNPSKSPGEALNFGDKTTALRFQGTPPSVMDPVLSWDLDGDGLFGEVGPGATLGDELGPVVQFDASHIDGPAQVVVTLRVASPTNSDIATDTALVDVINVPPVVQVTPNHVVIDEGASVDFDVEVTDPADSDDVTVRIVWDDGSETVIYLGAERSLTGSHTYVDDDPTGTPQDQFTARVFVTDDDGGAGSGSTEVTVANVAPVATLTSVADDLPFTLPNIPFQVDGILTDVGTADTHLDAVIDWGDGSSTTVPSNAISGNHTYASSGTYTIRLTVVDDDTGVGTATYDIDVVSTEEAIGRLSRLLDALIVDARIGSRLLGDASRRLAGSQNGRAGNGALDMLVSGRPQVTVLRLRQMTASLDLAEAAGVDTAPAQQLAALIAFSVADQMLGNLADLHPTPNRGIARQMDDATAAFLRGVANLNEPSYEDAINSFHDAVIRSRALGVVWP